MPALPRQSTPATVVPWPRWRDRLSRPSLRLRPALSSDLTALTLLQEAGLRPLAEVYYPWDSRDFADRFRPSGVRVLEAAGWIVAFYQIQPRGDHLFLAELHVRESERGLGLGRLLLRCALAEAGADGLPLRLWVLRNNPARKLYLDSGFRDAGEGACHHIMEWRQERPHTSPSGPVLSPTRSTLAPNRSSKETYRFVIGLPR